MEEPQLLQSLRQRPVTGSRGQKARGQTQGTLPSRPACGQRICHAERSWANTSGGLHNLFRSRESIWTHLMVGPYCQAWVPPRLLRSDTGKERWVLEMGLIVVCSSLGVWEIEEALRHEREEGRWATGLSATNVREKQQQMTQTDNSLLRPQSRVNAKGVKRW